MDHPSLHSGQASPPLRLDQDQERESPTAVLAEAISGIVRCDAILEHLPGREAAFNALVPTNTLCSDGELVRVGCMGPAPAGAFIHALEAAGRTIPRGARDRLVCPYIVVDQHRGPTTPCDWIEFARLPIGGT